MKITSTVFWPEHDPPVMANDVIDLPDAEAQERIAQGFAVEYVEPAAPVAEEPAQ